MASSPKKDPNKKELQAYHLIVENKDVMREVAADPNVIGFTTREGLGGWFQWIHHFSEGKWECGYFHPLKGEIEKMCPIHSSRVDDKWPKKCETLMNIYYQQHPTKPVHPLDMSSGEYYTYNSHKTHHSSHSFRIFKVDGWNPVATYSLYDGSARVGNPCWKCEGYGTGHCPFREQHLESLVVLELKTRREIQRFQAIDATREMLLKSPDPIIF